MTQHVHKPVCTTSWHESNMDITDTQPAAMTELASLGWR